MLKRHNKNSNSSREQSYSQPGKVYSASRKTCSRKISCFSVAGVCCKLSGVCLFLLTFLLINPATTSVSALEAESLAQSETTTSTVNISFSPTSGTASLTPTSSAGASALISVKATVGVENSGGYSVYLGGNSTNLVGAKTGQTIPGISGSATYGNLQPNTWGYYAGTGSSIPETAAYKSVSQGRGAVIFENTNSKIMSDSQTFTLGFAANISNSMPADTYQNTITLSVVSSPLELSEQFLYNFGITNMQQMSSSICSSAPVGATAQLTDTRDSKKYWITKLADSNCWMTQNLDLSVGSELHSSSTDSDWNWNRNSTYPPVATATSVSSSTVNNVATGTNSWDLGLYVITNPNTPSDCGSGKSGVSDCPSQFTAVGSRVVSTDPDFYAKSRYTGTSGGSCTKTANSPVSSATSGECAQYDAHYTVGNYYQWNAATVGTGGAITSGQADFSICPKNWKLPTSGSSESGSFGGLISASAISSDATKLTSAPYFFVRSGSVNQDTKFLFSNAGNGGNYWSSTPRSVSTSAYDLYFTGTNDITPDNYDNRRYGVSVRCIAR